MKISEAFELLGLPETASLAAIKDRYRAMAAGRWPGGYCHPDVGGDAGRFTRLVEAYRVAMGRVCPACGGKKVVVRQRGFASESRPCEECS